MSFLIVGRSDHRRKIQWRNAFLMAVGLAALSGLLASVIYFTLTRSFSPVVFAIACLGPFLTVGSGIYLGMTAPIDQLREIEP